MSEIYRTTQRIPAPHRIAPHWTCGQRQTRRGYVADLWIDYIGERDELESACSRLERIVTIMARFPRPSPALVRRLRSAATSVCQAADAVRVAHERYAFAAREMHQRATWPADRPLELGVDYALSLAKCFSSAAVRW